MLASLDAVWAYGTRKWTRLVRLRTATRRNRCLTDPRWGVVQSVTFDRSDGEVACRVRTRSLAKARRAVGLTLNFGARVGAVAPVPPAARARLGNLSDEQAEAYVQRLVLRVMNRAGAAAVDELLQAYGPQRAAAYLAERIDAACERRAIEDAA